MVRPIINFFKLMKILRERGNWPLIRRSRGQLLNFVFCRDGLNRKSIFRVLPYWFYLLTGLDVLVWRLETFGFLFPAGAGEAQKQDLNRYL